MLITTTDFIENKHILQTKDVIFSEQVLSVNVAKDFVNGIKGMFGTKLEMYAEEYRKAREHALAELKAQADTLECNAIANLKIYYNQFVNSGVIFITVMAYGNAVVIEDNPPALA